MAYKSSIQRYRTWYAKLLRFYSRPYYERFGEGMEQTFNDLLRERAEEERELLGYVLWLFTDTSVGIIKEQITFIFMQNLTKRLLMWAIAVAALLMVPLVAMQFTTEVQWTGFDFIFAAVLLFGTALAYELISRKFSNAAYRFAVALAVVMVLLLIWVNGAVGIIGNEGNPINGLYFGVILVGLVGAIVARLRPLGMSLTMFAMAVAQMAVPVIALIVSKSVVMEAPGVLGVFMLNAFFAALFVGSGLLFREAGATQVQG